MSEEVMRMSKERDEEIHWILLCLFNHHAYRFLPPNSLMRRLCLRFGSSHVACRASLLVMAGSSSANYCNYSVLGSSTSPS
jgi:hypothetical protein